MNDVQSKVATGDEAVSGPYIRNIPIIPAHIIGAEVVGLGMLQWAFPQALRTGV